LNFDEALPQRTAEAMSVANQDGALSAYQAAAIVQVKASRRNN
jgi:hypothetical protein